MISIGVGTSADGDSFAAAIPATKLSPSALVPTPIEIIELCIS